MENTAEKRTEAEVKRENTCYAGIWEIALHLNAYKAGILTAEEAFMRTIVTVRKTRDKLA